MKEKLLITTIAVVLLGVMGIVGAKLIWEPDVTNTTIVQTENFDKEPVEIPKVDTLKLDVKSNTSNIIEMSNVLERLDKKIEEQGIRDKRRMESIDNAIDYLVRADKDNKDSLKVAIQNLNQIILDEFNHVDYRVMKLDSVLDEYDKRFNTMYVENQRMLDMLNQRSIMVNRREIKKLERKIIKEKDSIKQQEMLEDLRILKGN